VDDEFPVSQDEFVTSFKVQTETTILVSRIKAGPSQLRTSYLLTMRRRAHSIASHWGI
jgi:hypothetical protein